MFPLERTTNRSSPLPVVIYCLLVYVLASGVAHAQEATPDNLLRVLLHENRYTLALDEGRITGPGADFLLKEAAQAHFFMVGEEHGIAEVPEFTSALFRALRPYGYEHLVIETSPSMAALLDRLARSGPDSLAALFSRYPLGVPFYSWHEEAQLLVDALEGAGSEPVLWGVDYEFVLSGMLWLSELVRRAPTDEARAMAGRYLAKEVAAEHTLKELGNPTGLFLVVADPEDFDALRSAFAADSGALALLDWKETSTKAWRFQFAGENYRSNLARTDFMRRSFAEQYRRHKGDRLVGPRAVLKFGGNHVFRGRTPVNVFDVGTLAAMLAEYEGSHAFNVMVVAGPGTERTTFHPTGPRIAPVEDATWATPLYEAADMEQWSMFDLRPLRPHLDSGRLQVAPEIERLIWGFDAYLVLVRSSAAGFDRVQPSE